MSEMACRKLTLRSSFSDLEDQVFFVHVSQPVFQNDKFACSFWIDGLPCGSFTRKVFDRDSLGALQRAILHIQIILNCIPQQFRASPSDFTFEDSPGLGVPLISEIHEGLTAYWKLDFIPAIQKLLPFAELGIAEIQLIVGSMYLLGPQTESVRDANVARHWLKAAAIQGNGQAWFLLCDPLLREPDAPPQLYVEYLKNAEAGGFALHVHQS